MVGSQPQYVCGYACNGVPLRADDWLCLSGGCQRWTFARSTICYWCNAPRNGAPSQGALLALQRSQGNVGANGAQGGGGAQGAVVQVDRFHGAQGGGGTGFTVRVDTDDSRLVQVESELAAVKDQLAALQAQMAELLNHRHQQPHGGH